MAREMRLVTYDSGWPEAFEGIRAELTKIFGPLAREIHHIGSTAVPGMMAKPIIDVIIVVDDINDVDALNDAMAAVGYIPRGENGIPGRRYFVMLAADGENHLRHIHCYEADHPHVTNELLFRDVLRNNQDAFREYASVKQEAAELYRFSPSKYEAYKTDCVASILMQAKKSRTS